jgi:hypothetical protein
MDYRRTAVVTFPFLFATSAFADAVGDARNALQRMTGSTPSGPKRGPSRRAATTSSRCASKTVRPSTDPASTATRAAPGPFADASETNADAR